MVISLCSGETFQSFLSALPNTKRIFTRPFELYVREGELFMIDSVDDTHEQKNHEEHVRTYSKLGDVRMTGTRRNSLWPFWTVSSAFWDRKFENFT